MTKILGRYIRVFLCALFCVNVYALEGGEYQTPDTWKRHYAAGGVKYSTGGVNVNGTEFDASVTSRTAYRYFEDELAEEFAYLRLKIGNIKAADGDISFSLYMRGAYASEEFKLDTFNSTKNGFYAERKDDPFALRVYQANAALDEVIPLTVFTVGRHYISYIDTQLTDGGSAEVSLLDRRLKLHALYGLPVSFYESDPDTYIYGGGADISPFASVRVRAEYLGYNDKKDDYRNDVLKARIDGKLPVGLIYLNYKLIDSANDIQAGTVLDFKPIIAGLGGTTISASVRTITAYYGEKTTNFIDPYSVSLGQEGKNTVIVGEVSQGITEWLVISIGGEGKLISGEPDYAHREFSHGYASIDLNGVFSPDLYIKITGDTWLAPADKGLKEESTFQIGGEVSYTLEELSLWGGTSFQKYRYYIPEENRLVYFVPMLKSFEEDARTFYLGGEYAFGTGLTVGADISVTTSSVFSSYNDEFNDALDTRVELNLSWVL
ncbi:MAG: DUF4774 domain-containing protein [Deferribacteraceae bacterium]|jgi:hypothetical protein|nr:DUF4774 domain-containing protein [Deferribacteraceae bacterium]